MTNCPCDLNLFVLTFFPYSSFLSFYFFFISSSFLLSFTCLQFHSGRERSTNNISKRDNNQEESSTSGPQYPSEEICSTNRQWEQVSDNLLSSSFSSFSFSLPDLHPHHFRLLSLFSFLIYSLIPSNFFFLFSLSQPLT